MCKYLVGVDIGTTAVKLAAFTTTGAMVSCAVCEYAIQIYRNQWAEADCDVYMDAISHGFEQMRIGGLDLEKVCAIGLSCQSETIFFLDEEHKPLRPAIVWLDNRAVDEAAYLRARFGDEECYRVTGQVSFQPAFPASKVLWVKNHQPELFRRTRWVFLMEEFILLQTTGKPKTDGAMLSSSAYWDIRAKRYWADMLEELEIGENMLAQVLESGEQAGFLLPEVAKKWGMHENVVVCTGGMDNAVGALGAGCLRPGQFAFSIGSSLAVCVPCDIHGLHSGSSMPLHYYVDKDMYMLHTFTTGGICLRWFRDTFCTHELDKAKKAGEDIYTYMDIEVAGAPAGCGGLAFLPHLNGSLAPDPNPHAKGVFYGISMQHERSCFMRAVMEAIGFLLRRNLEVLAKMGIDIKEVRAYGGGAKSAVWNQINADILQLPIHITDEQHAGCRGAAILAGKAVGIFKDIQQASEQLVRSEAVYTPDPLLAGVYDEAFGRYKGLMSVLGDTFASL